MTCGPDQFWAYDQSLGIWLKLLLDEVHERGWDQPGRPFADDVHEWALAAVLGGNHGLDLGPGWNVEQRTAFAEVGEQVQDALRSQGRLDPAEVGSWRLLDDQPIRRADGLGIGPRTVPIVDLGEALLQAVDGRLSPAPRGTWWMIGFADERTTIAMRG